MKKLNIARYKKEPKMMRKAIAVMADALSGQTRDDNKTLRATHCIRVYKILKEFKASKTILIAGILHDTIEDGDRNYDEIKKDFGKAAADIVASVSEDSRLSGKKRKADYILRIKKASTAAQTVKIADMLDNLWDSKKNMQPKYYAALKKYYKRFSFSKNTKKLAIYKKLKEFLS